MTGTERKTWLGGYVRQGKRGNVYVIERWIGGTHFHVSTRCRTERAALKELEKFEADPVAYNPGRAVSERLCMTSDMVLAYKEWMTKRRSPKPTTQEWADNCARFLSDWIEDFGGKDIRKLSVQLDMKPALDERKTSRKHRIEALKAFCKWLRTEKGLLSKRDDPTLDLLVPQDEPAQHKKKRAVDPEHIRAVLPFLDEEVRDILILLAGTGWHISEVRRFAASGAIIRSRRPGAPPVITTQHKSGRAHPTVIQHDEHLEAAERIRKRGQIPARWTLAVAMREACAAAGVPQFRLGVMRHTVATEAVEEGAPVEQVSEFLGHESKRTTERFYRDMHVPAKAVPVLRVVKQG